MTKNKVVSTDTIESKKKRKYNKYNNIPVEYNGIKFQSTWERDVWIHLKEAEKCGRIKDLQRQVRIDLHSPAVDKDNKIYLKKLCYYLADFAYYLPDETYVIADSKSVRTLRDPVFKLKAKMVLNELRYTS